MTELQLGLIGLGAVAVVGVLAYNKWQEYRHRKLAEQVLNVRHSDILLDGDGERRDEAEPPFFDAGDDVFGGDDEMQRGGRQGPEPRDDYAAPGERIEPVIRSEPEWIEAPPDEQSVVEPDPMPEPVAELAKPESVPRPVAAAVPVAPRTTDDARNVSDSYYLLSPSIDYVVSLEAVEPSPSYQIIESQRDVLARIRKPIHWIGYNEYTREWEPIVDDGQSEYRRIRVGLQLVDRKGAVSDGELAAFHIAIQDLADELMAMADFPPRQPALDAAAKLDEFCADVDIQVGINVISQGQVFAGTKLRALAEAAGMVIDEGKFVRCDDDGNRLFVLLNQDEAGFSTESMKTMSTHGVTFLLDVPRVSHGERVFNQMVDLARRFAEVLRGALVDDNHRPLSESALEPIRRQVGQYQASMATQGLPAGGPLARRLFS